MLYRQWNKVVSSTVLGGILVLANFSTVSCGGSKKTTKPNSPRPVTSTWIKDNYLPSSSYRNRCQFPRSGQNPVRKAPFPDQRGTMLDEMYYLRSLTNETYLFIEDITDKDPAKYNVVQSDFSKHAVKMEEYFDTLKSTKTTASGNPRDKYHYTLLSTDYYNRVQNKPEPSFGISWVLFSGYEIRNNQQYMQIPRDLRVRFVEAGSPAAELVAGVPKVKRGDKVLKVNGADFVRGTSSELNAILSPDSTKYTTVVFQDVDTNQEKTVVIKAKDISRQPVNVSKVIEVGDDKVGYIHYTTFATKNSDSSFNDAVKTLKSAGVDDLVLDIRYNGGGYLHVSSMVGYMIAGQKNTASKTFKQFVIQSGLDPRGKYPFFSTGQDETFFSVPTSESLASLDLNKVYILTTNRTCSASESLINGLIGIDVEVILIGATTCGKPYGFSPDDNCGITYNTIQFAGVNHKGFGAYADGFIPSTATSNTEAKVKGCVVVDDFKNQLGSEKEALLAAALKYRKDGKCPPLPAPPSPPSAIGAIASSQGQVNEPSPPSNLKVPDDPFYDEDLLLIPVD